MSFELWMIKVNNLLAAKVGVGSEDLPDYCWRDAFDDGLTPKEVVTDYLEENF